MSAGGSDEDAANVAGMLMKLQGSRGKTHASDSSRELRRHRTFNGLEFAKLYDLWHKVRRHARSSFVNAAISSTQGIRGEHLAFSLPLADHRIPRTMLRFRPGALDLFLDLSEFGLDERVFEEKRRIYGFTEAGTEFIRSDIARRGSGHFLI